MKKAAVTLLLLVTGLAKLFSWGPEPQYNAGKEYYICDEPINVRDEQGMAGSKIDRLYVGEKVKVISFGTSEAIDGNYGFYWTKIEFHNGKTGWIYGKYIATATVVCDLDRNGVTDYVFFRQRNEAIFLSFSYPEDIIVYKNGRKIPQSEFMKQDFSHAYFYISKNEDKVLFSMENQYESSNYAFPGDDDALRAGSDENHIYLFCVTSGGVQYEDEITDANCYLLNSQGAITGELKPQYIEPYLGKGYRPISPFR